MSSASPCSKETFGCHPRRSPARPADTKAGATSPGLAARDVSSVGYRATTRSANSLIVTVSGETMFSAMPASAELHPKEKAQAMSAA